MQIDDWELQGSGRISITGQDNMKGYNPKIPDGKHAEIHGWFKIEDAPRDGTEILAWIKYKSHYGYGIIKFQNSTILPWTDAIYSYKEENIIGWMPLPKPPKKKHYCGYCQNCGAKH